MGQMKQLIDELIEKKAKGNTFQTLNVQMKLMLKGIQYQKITAESDDDKDIIELIYEVAKDFNVELSDKHTSNKFSKIL